MPITVGQPITIDGVEFFVQKVLGKGGLSNVYLAKDLTTQSLVAIKAFQFPKFYDPITKKNDCDEYWENEVLNTQAQARSGMQCVQVLHFEKRPDLQTPEYYIVLNYIEGTTFLDFYREFIQRCRGLEHLDLTSIVRNIFIPLAELLEYCHTKEFLVHRDFSVANILIQTGEEGDFWPILIDWGVSKYVGEEWIHYTPKPFMVDSMPMDIPVAQKGAPPEVRFGYMPVAASDIYYLAHLMYFSFTGGIMREDAELTSPQAYLLSPKDINWYLPDQYNEMVKHLTQYEPADRPHSMTEVIKMLRKLIEINSVHFDFEFFQDNTPDTDELSGERLSTSPKPKLDGSSEL